MANITTSDPFSSLIDLMPKDHIFIQDDNIPSDIDFNLDLEDINWDFSIEDLLLPDENSSQSFNDVVTSHCDSHKRKKTRSCAFDDDKRNERLMRNRESAQLSRQRKKHYVEELEDKVRSLHSTIAELNNKISFFMSENASLKQQLGGNFVGPVPFPWIPFQAVAFQKPNGFSVPLVAIPKLKIAKNERRRSGGKSKKLASVSLLGVLLFLLIWRGLMFGFEERGEVKNAIFGGFYGQVLNVSSGHLESEEKAVPFDDHSYAQNSSDSVSALLYVSRNGKHVKINGNLIINSVLASEKAVARTKFGSFDSAVALSKASDGVERRSMNHGGSVEKQRALASDAEDASKERTLDSPLQQWFLEGLAGPIFSTGTCTEVFQFETFPNSEHSGIIPAADSNKTSSINTTENLHESPRRNRRFLYPRRIPLAASSSTNHSEHLGKAPESDRFPPNATATPMIVSILVDPREVGDADVDEVMSTKNSISRIFVVVLLDSVKYVTYSCVLPLISPTPHLVN